MSSTLYAMAPGPQSSGSAPAAAPGSALLQFLPLIVIFGLFYLLLIRPQQKQQRERQALVKALKPGDQVVTSAGIYGTVVKINEDDTIVVKVAEGVQIKMSRAAVENLAKKPA